MKQLMADNRSWYAVRPNVGDLIVSPQGPRFIRPDELGDPSPKGKRPLRQPHLLKPDTCRVSVCHPFFLCYDAVDRRLRVIELK